MRQRLYFQGLWNDFVDRAGGYRVGVLAVGHVVENRKKLLNRVSRMEGQMKALRETIEGAKGDADCHTVMQQVASLRGAMNGMLLEFLGEHIRSHVACAESEQERLAEAEVLMSAIKSFRS